MMELLWEQVKPDEGVIRVREGRILARYSYSTEQNHPYFWNLRPLNHDGVLSNHAPWDHRWHHGLWWSWKYINDVLYWEDDESHHSIRNGLGRANVVEHTVEQLSGDVGIREKIEWRESGTGAMILAEERRMTLHVASDLEDAWAIDWDMEWKACARAELSTMPYPEFPWGGYAGLNYRAARSMVAGEEIHASEGRHGAPAIHSHPAAWIAYLGNADGSTTDDSDHPAVGGVAIFGHPDNWGAPAPAYATSAHESFGFLAAAPLMLEDKILEPDEILRLRFRAVILGVRANEDELNAQHRQYSNTH